jgi:hypothetical protein
MLFVILPHSPHGHRDREPTQTGCSRDSRYDKDDNFHQTQGSQLPDD